MIKMQVTSAVMAALFFVVAGCANESRPSNFFVLTAPVEPVDSTAETTLRHGVSLGIGPIKLPGYLDRPQIVTRTAETSLGVDDFNRWGGELNDNIKSVLAEVISFELSTDRLQLYPWPVSTPIDYQVVVQVSRFEAGPGGEVLLDARWSILRTDHGEVIASGHSVLREPSEGITGLDGAPDYAAFAAAMSRCVARLGREIAVNIKAASTS